MSAALDRLKAILAHLYSSANPPHPLDPLSEPEIEHAIACVRGHISPELKLRFNTVTLHEPPKAEFLAWLGDNSKRPNRQAEVVAVDAAGGVYDGIVDLVNAKVLAWERLEGVQPMITMEDLIGTEKAVRENEKVIEQCGILGIPREDIGKVYCDRMSPRSHSLEDQELIRKQPGQLDMMSVSETTRGCSRR